MNASDPLITTLPIKALALPIGMLAACVFRPVRRRLQDWLWILPVPALLAACLGADGPSFVFDWPPYRLMITLDASGAMLLGTSALLWIVAGVFGSVFFSETRSREKLAISWLLTLIGSLGIFLAADLGLFLVFYALVSLPAYVMIIHDGTASSQRAGSIYLGFAILGEGLLLLAFVLLAATPHGGTLRIVDVVSTISVSPFRSVILSLLIAGFGMKMALVPLHFWMPLSYTAAPIPAAAVLSGAAVKAGVIGMIRFLPLGSSLPEWGHALAAVGLFSAFYGVAIGITQSNPKSILAYSSVSQMGFLATLLGMGLAAGDAGVASIASFYGAHHVLVKGALFLAIGVAAVTDRSRFAALVIVPATLIALGLAGLPLTGGALAKLAAKDPLSHGIVGTLASISAAGTTLLMLHFLQRLAAMAVGKHRPTPSLRLVLPWLTLVAAALVLPWLLFPLAGVGTLADALKPAALWQVLWPLLIGALLALVLRRLGKSTPQIPNGDVAALGADASRVAANISLVFERLDTRLRQWPVAGSILIGILLTLIFVMIRTH